MPFYMYERRISFLHRALKQIKYCSGEYDLRQEQSKKERTRMTMSLREFYSKWRNLSHDWKKPMKKYPALICARPKKCIRLQNAGRFFEQGL